ncbi:MAG: hypothetical protein HQ593_05520 [Candidatus Omnitrophica bacterium]|nr:hypothetical protein [Candidatus Omnitrophota bacterium]
MGRPKKSSLREKFRYEFDPFGQLVLKRSGKKSSLRRTRMVLDGSFKIDDKNSLIYNVKLPRTKEAQTEPIPRQIRLTGRWSVTPDSKLKLTLDESETQYGRDTLLFEGELLNPQQDSLLFGVKTRNVGGGSKIRTIRLKGAWRADSKNRLLFALDRGASGKYNDILLNGTWEIDRTHKIIYTYYKKGTRRGDRYKRNIAFKGFWDIRKKERLSYLIEGSKGSGFHFRASLLTPRIAGDKDAIKYEIGTDIRKSRYRRRQIVALFGKWRFKRGLRPSFEIKYSGGKPYSINFGSAIIVRRRNQLVIELTSLRGDPLGISIVINRRLLEGEGEAFLRLRKKSYDMGIEAGITRRW